MWPTHWQDSNWQAIARFTACMAGLALVWLAVLPFIGRQETIDAYIRRNERLGIDPSAKFYTELPAMPELFHEVQNRYAKPLMVADDR